VKHGRIFHSRWRFPRPLEMQVLAAEPDVAYVNSLDFAPETWLLRRASATALVVQDHASGLPGPFSITRPVRRRLMRAIDGFLFTASDQAEAWRSGGFIVPRREGRARRAGSSCGRPVAKGDGGAHHGRVPPIARSARGSGRVLQDRRRAIYARRRRSIYAGEFDELIRFNESASRGMPGRRSRPRLAARARCAPAGRAVRCP
jgi:hypothetical protein